MKVKIITSSEKFREDHNYREFFIIEIEGKKGVLFLDGEPEDANMKRDFKDVWLIPDLLKSAYQAGKNGEDFSIEECESDYFI